MPALFASLVLLMAATKKKPIKTGASSGNITNLKQSILETFNIHGSVPSRVDKYLVNPESRERISMIDLLVLTNSDQLLFILKL